MMFLQGNFLWPHWFLGGGQRYERQNQREGSETLSSQFGDCLW